MSNQNRICKGICKKFQVKKPAGVSRYGSGHGHCQSCNTWIDYRGCHMKNGGPAVENSLGWFCNCCNYRVRQNPRNRIYKEKLRHNQTNNESKFSNENHVEIGPKICNEFNIDINILSDKTALRSYQINLIKDITPIIEKYKSAKSYEDIRKEFQTNGKSIIPYVKSWKSWEEFIKLAFEDSPPNKISLIIEFERIKKKIGHLPSKLEFYELSKFGIDRYEKEFESWENFMELLRYDIEYRNLNLQNMSYQNSIVGNVSEIDNVVSGDDPDNQHINEIIKKIDTIRTQIEDSCTEKDMHDPANDYSYTDAFQLLQKYLKLLPNNSKYTNIRDFL